MTAPLLVSVALLAAAFLGFTLVLRHFRRSAVWITAVLAGLFPLLSDTSDWDSWFDWAKRYSIVIPTFFWAFALARPQHRLAGWVANAMPFVIAVNVLEAGLLELQGPNPLNGVLLGIVALLVPRRLTWDEDRREFGFRDAGWQVAYYVPLAFTYIFNPTFENGTALALIIVVVATLACLAERTSHGFITWRLYTLCAAVLLDSFFPSVSDHFYPPWLHSENRVTWNGTLPAHLWLATSAIIVALLSIRAFRQWRERKRAPAAPQPVAESPKPSVVTSDR